MKLLLPLLLLLCLELTLVCIHAEESSSMERNFNVEQISGYWFSIAEASYEREKIEEHGSMRAFVENITVLENSLVFKFHLIVNEECTEMTAIGEQTEKAGIYYMNYDGFNTFSILKTDYDNYIMIHLINKKDGKTFQLMELYGREPDLSLDIKEKFAKLCEEHGIIRENIIDLTNVNRCLEARE
uniref:Major urinary protein 3 n=1 Tax=Mus musculus TaxID=10090 RepID=MUP3_MOUSE|nr:RecName: Full=Major urinary protein 3; Short=MUP 3; AltName: Full=Non-group 1/group 2 MUP15; Flags: Precursor [Mus musculus]AAA39766.1 major urinary protein [Mus musculus]CAA27228.1 MUP [Mus musculus]